jgi:nitroreductase
MSANQDDALAFLNRRQSTPSRLLGEPGPSDAQVMRMLETAIRVPDHGRLAPWRFLRIRGNERAVLGQTLQSTYRGEHPDAPEAALEKERKRFANAPEVIAVVGRITPGHKIPEIEQRLSGGAVCFQLLLTAHAMGFGAQWLTGWAAYHPAIHAVLGLSTHEEILGFMHIGTAAGALPDHQRPHVRELVSDWRP